MELRNEFRVGVPVDEAWKVLTDLERIAPCMPGAQLQEVEGDEYRGVVKVKVGPITAQYKGTATWIERDESAHRAVVRAEGREVRGQGNANATVTATLTEHKEGTHVLVVTDLTISGKVAQFGRGVLADVSTKLLGQFVSALEQDVLSATATATATAVAPPPAADPAPAPEPAPAAAKPAARTSKPATKAAAKSATKPATKPAAKPAAAKAEPEPEPVEAPAEMKVEPPVAAEPRPDVQPAAASTGPRRIHQPEAEPVDLLDASGAAVLKRAAPLIGMIIVLLLLRRLLRGSSDDD